MNRIKYGFKALPLDKKQIEDRFNLSKKIGLNEFLCELYLDGVDISDGGIKRKTVDNLSSFEGSYSLHVPLIDNKNVFYDPQNIMPDYIGNLADLSHELNNAPVILHRCWAFNSEIGHEDAEAGYREWIRNISKNFPSVLFLIENYGFVFSDRSGKREWYTSPLDHFFPAEVTGFNTWLKENNITNVHPFMDVAHLNLTLNLLRAWEKDAGTAKRFIHKSLHRDIENKVFHFGRIEDCITDGVYPYFHISDSRSLPVGADYTAWPNYFESEGLVPGKGSIQWKPLVKKILDTCENPVFILEVNMKDPQIGVEQKKGIEFISAVTREVEKEKESEPCPRS